MSLVQTFERVPKCGEFRWVDPACTSLIFHKDAYFAGEWFCAAINVNGSALDGHPQRRPPQICKVDIRDLDTTFLGCEYTYECVDGVPGIEHAYGWWVLFQRRIGVSEGEDRDIVCALEIGLRDFWKWINPQLSDCGPHFARCNSQDCLVDDDDDGPAAHLFRSLGLLPAKGVRT